MPLEPALLAFRPIARATRPRGVAKVAQCASGGSFESRRSLRRLRHPALVPTALAALLDLARQLEPSDADALGARAARFFRRRPFFFGIMKRLHFFSSSKTIGDCRFTGQTRARFPKKDSVKQPPRAGSSAKD